MDANEMYETLMAALGTEYGLAVECHPDDIRMVLADLHKIRTQHEQLRGITIVVSPTRKEIWLCKDLMSRLGR